MTQTAKPRSNKPASGTPAPAPVLALNSPTRADGSIHANLHGVVERRFDTIELYADEDCKNLIATVHNTDPGKISNIGSSLQNYLLSIVDGAFSGTGQGPDGSAVFVRDNFEQVQKSTKNDITKLWLKLMPQSGARASVKGYIADVGSLIKYLTLRAEWVVRSEKVLGLVKTKSRTRAKTEETVTVII